MQRMFKGAGLVYGSLSGWVVRIPRSKLSNESVLSSKYLPAPGSGLLAALDLCFFRNGSPGRLLQSCLPFSAGHDKYKHLWSAIRLKYFLARPPLVRF